MKNESSRKRQAYLKRAAEMLEQKKKDEEVKDKAYYQRITTGTPWRLFGFGVILCY